MFRLKTKRAGFGMATVAILTFAAATFDVSSGSAAPSRSKPSSILFVNPLPKYPQWRVIGDCVAKQAKAQSVQETETGPTTGSLDAAVMIQQIQQGIANHVGALLTYPASPAFEPLLEQARKAGIIVATMYGAGAFKAANVDIGADFVKLGQAYADSIAGRKGPQHVGLIAVGPTGVGKVWIDAFRAEAKKVKNVSLDAVVYTNDDPTKALDASVNLLTAHPEINVLASHMGTATAGAVEAIKEKGDSGKVFFVANGSSGAALQGLKNHTIYRVLVQNLCKGGTAAVKAVVRIANGQSVPKAIAVQVKLIGLKSYKKYLAQGWS